MIKKLFFTSILSGISLLAIAQSIDINPNNGNRGQTLPIVISGQNTNFTSQGSATALLVQGSSVLGQGSQTAFTNINVIDPLTIMAQLNIPQNASPGMYDLYVTAGTFTSKMQAFTVNQPSNSAITTTPSGSKPGKTTTVSITVPGGSFKTQAQVVDKVWLTLGTEMIADVSNINVVNSTTFTADIVVPGNATHGQWDVNVYTDDDVMYVTPSSFLIDPTVSVPELDLVNLKLYPNPAQEQLNITFDSQLGEVEVKVFDIAGKEVTNLVNLIATSPSDLQANLTNLTGGVYMVQLIQDGKPLTIKKFVKE